MQNRRIVESLEQMGAHDSRTLSRLAQFIATEPQRAVDMPIAELANAAGSSAASLVRLAHKLGFSGYREFRGALRDELAFSRGRDASIIGCEGAEALTSDIDPEDSIPELIAKIAFADSRAVNDTAAGLDPEALAHVRDTCVHARHIVTFGVGASAFAAMDLQQKLSRIGMRATSHTDAHHALPAASLLEPGDVAIGISHSGQTVDVLDAIVIAQDQGATTIAITNSPSSQLTEIADLTLLTDANESPLRSGATASRIAQLTLVDMVFVAIAQMLSDQSRRSLARTYAAIASRKEKS